MIKKHGRHYWLDVRVRGRRVRRSLGTGERSLALARAHKLERDLRQAPVRTGPTFDEFADQYLAWARTQKPASYRTEASQLGWIRAFMVRRGVQALSGVTPYLVEQMRTELLAEKKPPRTRATVNRYAQLVRNMFYRAEDWGVHPGPNPVKKVRFFRERPDVKPLSDADYAAVLEVARGIAAGKRASPIQRVLPDLVEFLANTGLRRSEALFLKWSDVRGGAATVVGKGDKRRQVPLNAAALGVLGRQPRAGEYVFDVPNWANSTALKRTFRAIEARTGIRFYLHLLRHYFATSLLERGVDIVTISELLGHSRAMTSLIYSHSDPARKRAAVDTLADTRPSDVLGVVRPSD